MKDFSFWKEYEGASEGSGRSEKIWLINPDTNQIGLFKYKKDSKTTDHASECIASDLAGLLGISCAKVEIGTYLDQEGSMSYNIVRHEGTILIEGIYCISSRYRSYNADKLVNEEDNSRYSLEMIRTVLEPFHLWKNFLTIPIFDFLIGNTDRHQSNWALIMESDKESISPLYDNSSSLCAYVAESKIESYLGKDICLWKSLVDTKSKSLIRIRNNDLKQPTHLEVIKYLQSNYLKETESVVQKVIETMTDKAICDILDKYYEVLSKEKKELIRRFILSKVQLMNEVYRKSI